MSRTCYYCGIKLAPKSRILGFNKQDDYPTKDHINPKRLRLNGASDETVMCCRKCNTVKSNATIDEWKSFMSSVTNWHTHHVNFKQWIKHPQAQDGG